MNVDTTSIYRSLRKHHPLVQCITNYVSMDIVANTLNAAGASPAMVHDINEAGEFAGLASAVVVNIGTPSQPWVDGMIAAASVAHERGTPWVLDPVAVGATSFRRTTVSTLLEYKPTVIRGNASEIRSLALSTAEGRGVDSDTPAAEVREEAMTLAQRTGSVVVVTGEEDLVVDNERAFVVRGGDSRMPMITALGCAVSAVVGACCAVESDAAAASATALAMMAIAGERAGIKAEGPGSLRWRLLDELSSLTPEALSGRVERQ